MEELRPQAPKSRCLRRVVERIPKPYYETDKFLGTRMVGVHILEKLECGHVKDAFPQFDPLTARYRTCTVCASKVVEFPASSPVTPAMPARVAKWRLFPPGRAA